MIKIIKEGAKKIIECPECGCLFSYDKEDIQKQLGKWVEGPFGDVQEIVFSIECPQCKNKIGVNND